MSKRLSTVLLVIAAVLVVVGSLWLGSGGEFGGADAAASDAVSESGYHPWFSSLWKSSPEVESGLFAMQAALGGLVVGWVLGTLRERRRQERTAREPLG